MTLADDSDQEAAQLRQSVAFQAFLDTVRPSGSHADR